MAPPDPFPVLRNARVIPVLTIETVETGLSLARALAAGGLPVIEVTLRTPAALDVIKAISSKVPEVTVGAGTLTKPADIEAAEKAGSQFLVSPGTPDALAAAFAASRLPAIPGCATPSEAMALAARGFRLLKFFPAEPMNGIAWLKQMIGPLSDLRFCTTGGLDMKLAAAYLAVENVTAVGGGWMAPKDAVAKGDFARVTALAREAAALGRQ